MHRPTERLRTEQGGDNLIWHVSPGGCVTRGWPRRSRQLCQPGARSASSGSCATRGSQTTVPPGAGPAGPSNCAAHQPRQPKQLYQPGRALTAQAAVPSQLWLHTSTVWPYRKACLVNFRRSRCRQRPAPSRPCPLYVAEPTRHWIFVWQSRPGTGSLCDLSGQES